MCEKMEQTTNPTSFLREKKIPHFPKPKLIGYFSIGAQRNRSEIANDVSQLKYINKIPVGRVDFDLNHNITTVLKKPEGEKKTFFFDYLKDHKEALNIFDQSDVSLKDVPFMCSRGLLAVVSGLPYTNQESFRFSACLFRGVIYFEILTTTEAQARKDNITEREKIMEYWGLKFEQYIVSDEPCGHPNIEPPVDERLQFLCLYEGQLNQHRLFYGAEMDGILVEGSSLTENFPLEKLSEEQALVELRKLQFVELKTSRLIDERRHDITFRRHKTRTWWLQNFLVGVETIICGFRDDDGIVKEVQKINLNDLPKQGRDFWYPGVCMNFCDELLSYIKECFDREIVKRFGSCGNNVRRLPLLELVFERMPWSSVRLGQPFPNEDISFFDDRCLNMFPKF